MTKIKSLIVRNIYKVPKKNWDEWSKDAKAVFNSCYDYLVNNQDLISHPKAMRLPALHWKTVAWNAALAAADALTVIRSWKSEKKQTLEDGFFGLFIKEKKREKKNRLGESKK